MPRPRLGTLLTLVMVVGPRVARRRFNWALATGWLDGWLSSPTQLVQPVSQPA